MYSLPFNFAIAGLLPSQEFGIFHKMLYLCTRRWFTKQAGGSESGGLFNAIYSRTLSPERSPNRNPKFSQSSASPLDKEILQFLTKLRKNERNAKGKFAFLFISECRVSSVKPKLQKVERNIKQTRLFLFPRRRICVTLCTFRSKNFAFLTAKLRNLFEIIAICCKKHRLFKRYTHNDMSLYLNSSPSIFRSASKDVVVVSGSVILIQSIEN